MLLSSFNISYNDINDVKHQVQQVRQPDILFYSYGPHIHNGLSSQRAVLVRPISKIKTPKVRQILLGFMFDVHYDHIIASGLSDIG